MGKLTEASLKSGDARGKKSCREQIYIALCSLIDFGGIEPQSMGQINQG